LRGGVRKGRRYEKGKGKGQEMGRKKKEGTEGETLPRKDFLVRPTALSVNPEPKLCCRNIR